MAEEPFDALAAATRLNNIGMDREQADAVAKMANEAAASGRVNLVTKPELDAAIKGAMFDLTWRMIALAVLVVGAIKLIP